MDLNQPFSNISQLVLSDIHINSRCIDEKTSQLDKVIHENIKKCKIYYNVYYIYLEVNKVKRWW